MSVKTTRTNLRENLLQLKLFRTGSQVLDRKRFTEVNSLFTKARVKKALDKEIRECRACPNMNLTGHSASAPGYGNLNAKIFFVGQSLCTACMATQIPFTKGSGYAIDAALMLSELTRRDVFITNVIHCHPPGNRSSESSEIRNCVHYLMRELVLVKPDFVVALGSDANRVIQSNLEPELQEWEYQHVKHPASFLYGNLSGLKDWIIDLSMELIKYGN